MVKLWSVVVLVQLFFLVIQGSGGIQLSYDTVWVVDENEVTAVQMAINDVAKDWYKVIGAAPTILNAPPSSWSSPLVFLGYSGSWWKSFNITFPAGSETFKVAVTTYGGATAVIATGSDMRGSIYAVYAFSEKILNVDPQWYWIDLEPDYQGSVTVPNNYSLVDGPPTFKYRGWFVNDEDLLGGFANDPLGEQVFDSTTWDMIYQTMLRMKGNTFIVGTVPFPDERSITLAARRGIIVTNHHFNLLGINTFRWPTGVPFSLPTDPAVQFYVWEACVKAQMNNEMLWSIGYRGLNDYPFWQDDPEINTDQKRAAVINQAMANQTAIVNKLLPNSNPQFIFYLWSEMNTFYFDGLLNIPKGVTIVWSDDGTGMVIDADKAIQGGGLYYHVMMYNYAGNQLTEMVPPRRIFDQIGIFVTKKATSLLMINLSDLRPVPVGTLATTDFGWNATKYMSMSPVNAEAKFFRDFALAKYGNSDVADVLQAYFGIPYMANNASNFNRIADNYFSAALQTLSSDFSNAIKNPQDVATLLADAAKFEAYTNLSTTIAYVEKVLSMANSYASKVPPSRLAFYNSHVTLQSGIHMESLYALNDTIASARSFATKDFQTSTTLLQSAISHVEKIFAYERTGEYGRWRGFFKNDILTGFPLARTSLKSTLSKLASFPPIAFPYDQYYDWYNYQLAFDNYPYIYDSTEKMDFSVRILCHISAGCENTPVGGNFSTTPISLQMQVDRIGLQIRYTLNDTMPTVLSPLYTTPISISQNTIVTAASFGNVSYLPSRTAWYYNPPKTIKQSIQSNININ